MTEAISDHQLFDLMPEPKTECRQCGAEILVATAKRTGGICMPCSQKANPQTYEITLQDEERIRKKREIIKRLIEGCSEEEFAALRCPICGSALNLHVHPNLQTFAVSCATNTLHLFMHESILAAPAWWNGRISGGWLDDGDSIREPVATSKCRRDVRK